MVKIGFGEEKKKKFAISVPVSQEKIGGCDWNSEWVYLYFEEKAMEPNSELNAALKMLSSTSAWMLLYWFKD